MPAGLVVPISGPYTATYNALPLGTQNDDGFQLRCTIQGQEVSESDAFGLTLVEMIYRGQNWRLLLTGLEFNKTGLLASLQAFGQTGANTTLTPQLVNVGDRATKYAQSLVLTAILANPPTMPQTLTASNAIVASGQDFTFLMTSKLREFPMQYTLIPYSTVVGSLTVNVPFTTT